MAVEHAGFDAVWAGSLKLATACGLVDEEVITTTEVLTIVTQIIDAIQLPVLVDFDTGHGCIGTLARAVRLLSKHRLLGFASRTRNFLSVIVLPEVSINWLLLKNLLTGSRQRWTADGPRIFWW